MNYYLAGQQVALVKSAGIGSLMGRAIRAPFRMLGRGMVGAGKAMGRGALGAGKAMGRGVANVATAPIKGVGSRMLGAGEGVVRGLRGLRTQKSLLGRATKGLVGKQPLVEASESLRRAAIGSGGAGRARFNTLSQMAAKGPLDPRRAATLQRLAGDQRLAMGVGLGTLGAGAAGAAGLHGAGQNAGLIR